MTSMPASRSAAATTLAPRSCPSRPGLATSTRMGRALVRCMELLGSSAKPEQRGETVDRIRRVRLEDDIEIDSLAQRLFDSVIDDVGGRDRVSEPATVPGVE